MVDPNMRFNLNPLYAKGIKIAVWCPDENMAIQFVSAARKEHPKHFRHWTVLSGEDNENWSRYKERTCYCPSLNGYDGTDYFQFGSKGYFEENGYIVIHVNDLVGYVDLGEFEPARDNALAFFM